MRMLFTCVPSHGRFFTIAGLARAAAQSGHDVLVATATQIHHLVREAGLRAAGVGKDIVDLRAGAGVAMGETVGEDRIALHLFTKLWPRAALADILAVADGWRPDVIVHEEGEFSGAVAATLLNIPNIVVSWTGPMRLAEQWKNLETAIAPLWQAYGLRPPPRAGVFRSLFLDQCPPSLQTRMVSPVPRSAMLRPIIYDGAQRSPAPPWISALETGRVVFATLGTVAAFNRAPSIFSSISKALERESLQLVLTIGAENKLADLGNIPASVHVERFLPQSLLNSKLALVICHAGPGTTISALSSGVPLLLIPRGGAVQARMARMCESSGVARVLSEDEVTPSSICSSVHELLQDRRYAQNARRLASEIGSMPDISTALALISDAVESARGDGQRRRKH